MNDDEEPCVKVTCSEPVEVEISFESTCLPEPGAFAAEVAAFYAPAFEPGHRMLYGELRLTLPAKIRATSSGIATVGCHASTLGVHSTIDARFNNPHSAFVDVDSIRAYLDGSERWQIAEHTDGPIEEWTIEKTAGPFEVEVVSTLGRKGGVSPHLVLRCACGWATKPRHMTRRRLLNSDQAQHRCLTDRKRS